MKTLIQFLLATFTILACVCCKTAKEEKTDDKLNEITFADPTIFVENGKYYLTGNFIQFIVCFFFFCSLATYTS